MFESAIYESLYSNCKQLFSPNQHSFLRARSTTTNLTEFVSRTLNALESGSEVDAIATDFSKAFDKISHEVILFKLHPLGFPPRKWFDSYLRDREYRVIFRSASSESFKANSGVLQGSHLGPLIFILTINDVDQVISSSYISIYADDMKIYRVISSPHDCISLQRDLDNFGEWCHKSHLELNVDKCQAITYSRKKLVSNRVYYLNEIAVNKVNTIRDWGELNFISHFNNIICRANTALGFVKRWSKEFSDPYVTKALYITFMRPILEYGSQVWSPYQDVHIKRIEAVQRRFIRFALRGLGWADPVHLPPYEDRLKLINLNTLQTRRMVADIVFMHQTIASANARLF